MSNDKTKSAKIPALVYTLYIRATPKQTYDAVTKPDLTRQYWGGIANVSDWKRGSKWEHTTKDNEIWIAGKVVEATPSKRLAITWADPDELKDESRVTIEFAKLEDMTQLTVTHDQFKAGSSMADKVAWGWPRVLCSLKTFLETGKGLNIFAGVK